MMTQRQETRYSKKIEKRLRKNSEVIPVTDEFKEFCERISEIYSNDKSVRIFSRENEKVDTYCERVKVQKRFITECFVIGSEKYYVMFTPLKDGVYLYMIKVSPIYRNMGLGNSLMKMFRDISNELNIPIRLVPVPLGNDNVGYETLQKFYKNHGYSRETNTRYWKYEPNSIQNEELSYGMVS